MRFAEIFKTELFSKYGQKAGCYINEIYDIRFGLPVYDDKTGNLDRYNIFTAILLIKHSEDGNKYLHDITTIKKETSSPLES